MDPNFHVTSATFNHKFTQFSRINKLTPSPACWIQNMPWKIFIEPVVRQNKKYLSVFVSCAAPITNNPWSCKASVRMYKLEGTKPKIIKTTKYLVFDSSASTSWGHDTFIFWDTVLNPSNGFIRNDSIVIEVIIDAEIPVGLKLTAKYFTDERATVAVKICDQTILNLQAKLRELTNQNEQLRIKEKTSSEEIENLKNIVNVSENKSSDLEKKYNKEHASNIELQNKIDVDNKQLQQEKEKNGELTKVLNEKKKEIDNLDKKMQEFGTTQEELTNCKKQNEEASEKYASLLNEFENYRRVLTTTGSESENLLKTQIDTMKNENVEFKKKFASLQNELDDANVKLKQIENLKEKVQELDAEKTKMRETIDSISEEVTKSETLIEMMKKDANKEQDEERKEKEKYKTQVQSLKSQLYESLVKLQISQDMNEDIQKMRTEKNELIEKMKIGYEKYNNLKQERESLNSQIEKLNQQLSDADESIKKLKNETQDEKTEMDNCKKQLEITNSKISDLDKINNDLKATLTEANSKMKSSVKSSSEDITNSVIENEELKNENDSLKSQLDIVRKELKGFKDQKSDENLSSLTADKTKLETKLADLQKELQETKIQLQKSQADVNKMIHFERNLLSLQSQFDSTKNKLKQLEERKLDEALSRMNEEKTTLQELITSLKKELEDTKTKLNNHQIEATQAKSKEDENVKLKEQISSLQKILDRTNTRIETMNVQKNQIGNTKNKRKGPDFGVDIVNETENGKTEPVQKQQIVNTSRSSDQEDVEELAEITPKGPLELRLETMRKEFEKQIKDVDHAMMVERQTLMKRIEDLLHQLGETNKKQEYSEMIKTQLKGEICRLKEETNALRELKEESFSQLNKSKHICEETFQIVIAILKNLKVSGKLSCTVEAHILLYLNNMKQCEKVLSPDNFLIFTQNVETRQLNSEISTDVLQNKLDQLKSQYEESLNVIRKNSLLEHNENTRLRTANNELLVLIENEMNIAKQYKEMLKIANSRLENLRKQFNELDNKLLDEKYKRCECEESKEKLKLFNERIETSLGDMKQKMLRHAINLSDFEAGMISAKKNHSDDDQNIFSCGLAVTSSATGTTSDLPAKITNDSNQDGKRISSQLKKTENQLQNASVTNTIIDKNKSSTNTEQSGNGAELKIPKDGQSAERPVIGTTENVT